jgi:hypothetical protein
MYCDQDYDPAIRPDDLECELRFQATPEQLQALDDRFQLEPLDDAGLEDEEVEDVPPSWGTRLSDDPHQGVIRYSKQLDEPATPVRRELFRYRLPAEETPLPISMSIVWPHADPVGFHDVCHAVVALLDEVGAKIDVVRDGRRR